MDGPAAEAARFVLLAVEDHTGSIANPDGIDADDLAAYVAKTRGVAGYPQARPVDHETFLSTQADIFVPAALEGQITAETAPLLNVHVVFEGANGPTDLDGDRILAERGIELLPDILCNGGGVIVSYFEWLQNKRSESWDLEEVDAKLHKRMIAAYEQVRDTRQRVTPASTGALRPTSSRCGGWSASTRSAASSRDENGRFIDFDQRQNSHDGPGAALRDCFGDQGWENPGCRQRNGRQGRTVPRSPEITSSTSKAPACSPA